MANLYGTNPIILDTADANTDLAPLFAGSPSGRFKIRCIRWTGATTVTHTAVIKDNAGNIIWDDIAARANALQKTIESPTLNLWIRSGLRVATLDSGKLYIYLVG